MEIREIKNLLKLDKPSLKHYQIAKTADAYEYRQRKAMFNRDR